MAPETHLDMSCHSQVSVLTQVRELVPVKFQSWYKVPCSIQVHNQALCYYVLFCRCRTPATSAAQVPTRPMGPWIQGLGYRTHKLAVSLWIAHRGSQHQELDRALVPANLVSVDQSAGNHFQKLQLRVLHECRVAVRAHEGPWAYTGIIELRKP